MQRFVRRHGDHALPLQPALPGQHARADARRDRGARPRRLRALRRRDLPAHVGGAEEARRSGGAARGARGVRPRRREAARARAGARREAAPDREHRGLASRAEPSARRPSSWTTRSTSARTGCATSRKRSWRLRRRHSRRLRLRSASPRCALRLPALRLRRRHRRRLRLRSASPRCALRLPGQLGFFGGNCARISSTAALTRSVTCSGFGSSFRRPTPMPRHTSLRLATSITSMARVPSS